MDNKKLSLIEKKIKEIVGQENFSKEITERFCYIRDAAPIDVTEETIPDIIVWPRDSCQISKIVMLANKMLIPIVPRGAGSGECGGAMPIEGGIVLDFTFMKSVLKIDDENMMCLVEPGIVCAELNAILAKRGFFFTSCTGQQ